MTQQEAFDILKLGYNVYLTGPAGSGKTFLLNKYIEYLKKKGVKVGITASTGIAATHLDGRTIHSWSGIGIKDELTDKDLRSISNRRYLRAKLRLVNVLIIDEISMLHSFRLDMVDKVCKAVKQSNEPFGGMQVVLCGDFFQLPPVCRNGEDPSFVNTSEAWRDMNIQVCYLDEQHRHKDGDYMQVLNEIRDNNISETGLRLLINCQNREIEYDITATKLYTHNADVDAINDSKLEEIDEKEMVYQMTSTGSKKLVEKLKDGCLAPEELFLKKGAVVMFVKNKFSRGFVNGTLGEVVSFDSEDNPIVQTVKGQQITANPESWEIEENGTVKAKIDQIPLRLAWAITVHKSQGMSLDAAEIDLSRAFEYGMGYVALSRVRSLKGLKLVGINALALRVSDGAVALDSELKQTSQRVLQNLQKLDCLEKEEKQRDFLEAIAL
ncbi:MAG: PIF1 family DEAD/DEAH box helicase [Patescibacteria group bacterium]|nr:PIF1 family DEAD/DEAH box helicase [Patescibacteria group bacterium]